LFIGAFDHERAAYLDELHSSLLDIYGDAKWKTRNILRPFIRKAYMNKALYGSEYMQAISSSMGIVNLLRKQNILEDSHNMRTFEVPGFGGLLVSQRTSEQLEYFEEDREAVFFENVEELRDKLEYLSKNRNVVTAIKQAAYKRSVHANYSYDNRSKQLLKCLQDEF
jgi:spore maturation protein CgeB